MQDVVAQQVAEAIVEYAEAAEFEVGIIGGELVVATVFRNEKAWVKSYVPLIDVIQKAVSNSTTDPAFLHAMQLMSTQIMGGITRTPTAPPTRGMRAGMEAKAAMRAAAAEQQVTTRRMPVDSGSLDGFGSPMARR
jgi:hypothetical protein